MKAVQAEWDDGSVSVLDGGPFGTEAWLERAFWMQPYSEMKVLFDNGQICTFKRKARSTKDNE